MIINLANPQFNVSDWSGHLLRDDQRWQHGVPRLGNANYAWIQRFLYHLARSGTAGFVMANQSGEGDIRKNSIEAESAESDLIAANARVAGCAKFLPFSSKTG